MHTLVRQHILYNTLVQILNKLAQPPLEVSKTLKGHPGAVQVAALDSLKSAMHVLKEAQGALIE